MSFKTYPQRANVLKLLQWVQFIIHRRADVDREIRHYKSVRFDAKKRVLLQKRKLWIDEKIASLFIKTNLRVETYFKFENWSIKNQKVSGVLNSSLG